MIKIEVYKKYINIVEYLQKKKYIYIYIYHIE